MEKLQSNDPQQVGSYWLIGRLGSGGMGQVFLGQSPGGRLVAVKVIRPELADGADFRGRFAREVAAARRVSGIFTAPVVDADPAAPQPWLVTAYVDGPSLGGRIEHDGPMPESDVITLGLALAEGLSAIHAAGIVHRDLKPANVLLASDGPRIIDFGISRALGATSLTQTGWVVGSPGFMSPEQADGRDISPASDIFSLGAVLAFAATGADPFGSGAASALLYRVVHAEPALTGVSVELRSVLEACLRKNPADRPTPGALLAMLTSLADEQTLATAGALGVTNSSESYRASHSPAEPRNSGTALPSATARASRGTRGTRGTATLGPLPTAGFTRRRSRWAWIFLCAVIALAAAGGLFLASHGSGTGNPPRTGPPGTTRTTISGPSPRSVVESYYAAINAHDWRRVWQLGGKNLSPSYATMVAGFHETSRDVITRITASGDAVTVRLRAYETTGRAQVYVDRYTVSGAVIANGHQTLISG